MSKTRGRIAMKDERLRGAAFHEAGHAIVAREFGLPVGEIRVGIDGDDAKGESDIGLAHHLPLIDQIALCVAGVVAQLLFDSPTHNLAGASDYGKVIELVEGMTAAESLKLRHTADARAREILQRRAAEVKGLAVKLIKHRRVNDFE
jgi:hypothetical protein